MRMDAMAGVRPAMLVLLLSCAPAESPPQPAEAPAPATAPSKRVIAPPGYRPTASPLSPAILVGNTLYLSGATGGDPATGQLVSGGFEPEMRQILANMQTVLAAADMRLDDVVQVTTYLADMADFARYNEIYREYFTTDPLPTRATVAVRELARGARIEIIMVAAR
jgi:2-iminobutanoate/2-iminopropanoate deaminase